MKKSLLIIVLLFSLSVPKVQKVGVIFSGGAEKGLAHIGVQKTCDY